VLVGIRGDGDVDDEGGTVEYGEASWVVRDALDGEPVRLPVGQRPDSVDDALAVLGPDAERRVGRRAAVCRDETERVRRHDAVVLIVDDQSQQVLVGRDAARQCYQVKLKNVVV